MPKPLYLWKSPPKSEQIDVKDCADVDSNLTIRVDNKKGNYKEKLDKNLFPPPTLFEEIKPLAWVMLMNQLWPVQACDAGRVQASVCNFAGVTSLLLFCGLLPLHLLVLVQHVNLCWEERKSFASLVYHITYPAIAHYLILTPLIAWVPASSLADYFNAWTDFQDQWHHRLKRPLSFHFMRKRSLRTAVRGVVSAVLVTMMCFALAESLRLTHLPSYTISTISFFLRSGAWIDMCAIHEKVANQLGDILCDTLKSDDQTERLRSLRSTWLSLRSLSPKLASGAGAIPPLYYFCYLLAVSLISSVGVLMAILRNAATAVTGAQLIIALNELFAIAKMHQAGHKASHAVKWSVLRPLLTSKLLGDNVRDYEILSFLWAIDRNPSVITIGDFTACSRSALMLFLSAYVTYILVLVQFAYSVSSEGDRVLRA